MMWIIETINKLVSYLNINTKYSNRAYILISALPILYISRISYGYYQNNSYLKGTLLLILFLFLIYFLILNYLYYFHDISTKYDITRLLYKYLPEDMFITEEEEIIKGVISEEFTEFEIEYEDNHDILLASIIDDLKKQDQLQTQKVLEGYEIRKNTLIPFYQIKYKNNKYIIYIGTNYENLIKIGEISSKEDNILFLGLYIEGGIFWKNNVEYFENYSLNLVGNYKNKKFLTS